MMASGSISLIDSKAQYNDDRDSAAQVSTNQQRRRLNVEDSLAPFSGFFRRSLEERASILAKYLCDRDGNASSTSDAESSNAAVGSSLSPEIADVLVENCIGILGMPMGVAPTFSVNGIHYIVPMCTEESSVIAAASSAAKLIALNTKEGGFVATSTRNMMIGQIQILDIANVTEAHHTILAQKSQLIEHANTFCANMKKRGGGVIDIEARIIEPSLTNVPETKRRTVLCEPYVVVHVHVCFELFSSLS